MKKLLIKFLTLQLILWPLLVAANQVEESSKSIDFDKIISPNYKKVKFKISTRANKDDVQLEFEAMKLSAGKYAVYKTPNCDLKNFSANKLKKLSSNDLFFSFSTTSGNIFEERKIDFRDASKFNIGIFSFVLVKVADPKTAVICFSQ